jgi:hypothetical protein
MLCRQAAWSLTSPTAGARILALVASACALHLGACAAGGNPENDLPTAGAANGGSGGTGGTGGTAGDGFALTMSVLTPDGQALEAMNLNPGAVADVVVHAEPPAAHTLRFGLLGAPLDAVLGATEVATDPSSGDAHVSLLAPSSPTTFTVRATTTAGPFASLDFAVPQTNMALLAIKPSYAGERVVKNYVASAWENKTCADSDLKGSPPMDGDISASADAFPVSLLVPANIKLAVLLRAERFAWGCTTVNAAIEGIENDVEVVMTNVPMNLDASDVDFTLTLDPPEAFAAAAAAPEQGIVDAVLGTAEDDVDALLSAMAAKATNTTDFGAARTSLHWDSVVQSALGTNAAEALRAPLTRWMQSGTDGDNVKAGLVGSIQGMSGAAPKFTLSSVFGVAPEQSGFTPASMPSPSWEAGADDGVLIGMSMTVSPATFLLAAAEGPALAEVADAHSVSEALAAIVSCNDVATALVANGVAKGESTSKCALACTEQLCESAVAQLLAAAAASDRGPSELDVALTASGRVGGDAELTAFSGNWLGHWSISGATNDLAGPASGTATGMTTP